MLEVLSKVTVLLPAVNVPPDFVQLPDTVNVLDGAVSVPLESVSAPFTSNAPPAPVYIPPLMVRPPLKVEVADELAVYVPPDNVARPVTVTVLSLVSVSKVPLLIDNAPLMVMASRVAQTPPLPFKVKLLNA